MRTDRRRKRGESGKRRTEKSDSPRRHKGSGGGPRSVVAELKLTTDRSQPAAPPSNPRPGKYPPLFFGRLDTSAIG